MTQEWIPAEIHEPGARSEPAAPKPAVNETAEWAVLRSGARDPDPDQAPVASESLDRSAEPVELEGAEKPLILSARLVEVQTRTSELARTVASIVEALRVGQNGSSEGDDRRTAAGHAVTEEVESVDRRLGSLEDAVEKLRSLTNSFHPEGRTAELEPGSAVVDDHRDTRIELRIALPRSSAASWIVWRLRRTGWKRSARLRLRQLDAALERRRRRS